MPQNWTYTEHGFQIFSIIEQNFIYPQPLNTEAAEIRKTVRPV
jgi:hypothetical protein